MEFLIQADIIIEKGRYYGKVLPEMSSNINGLDH